MCVALKDTRVKREKTASPASREIWVSKATGENLDQQDPEVKMALRGQRVVQGFQEMLVLLVQVVRRVNLEFLDCQDTQEDKDQRDLRVSKVSLVPMERKELGEQQESRAHADREDQRVLEEREDQEDRQEKLVQRVTQGMTAHRDLPVRGDCLGLRDQQVSQDQRAPLDLQGKTDCQDILDREEKLDSKAKQALLVLQEWLDLRDQQVRLDKRENVDTLDPRDHLVSKVCLELQEKKEPRVILALLARLVKMAHLGKEVSLEREVCLVLWELMA